MTAKSRNEAWWMVDQFFHTDYTIDTEATVAAGYDIYKSTSEGCEDWISDLGNCLEINFYNGKTIRVNIDDQFYTKRETKWSADDVMQTCIKHGFYTCGTADHYTKMLDYVRDHEYTDDALAWVATDIAVHSEEQTISNVMFILYKEAVNVFFEIAD